MHFRRHLPAALLACLATFVPRALAAQDNYEIQVYGAETTDPGATMLELHSNFTVDGRTTVEDGVRPTDHALHETVEVTHGFTGWFEVGFYAFTTAQEGGWHYVGSHIRPRVRVPDAWHWPLGVSVSQEIGCQDTDYAGERCNYELRPIVDKQWGRWYWAVNPALEAALTGPDRRVGFSPSAKVSYRFSRRVTGGVEYYGGMGPLADLLPADAQEHQIYPAVDLDLGPGWEFNAGVGFGLTPGTDRLLAKVILGRRLGR
jgi:hypothetical protein